MFIHEYDLCKAFESGLTAATLSALQYLMPRLLAAKVVEASELIAEEIASLAPLRFSHSRAQKFLGLNSNPQCWKVWHSPWRRSTVLYIVLTLLQQKPPARQNMNPCSQAGGSCSLL